MILYNITTKIAPHFAKAWLTWQREEQMPEILATGLFESYQIFRLMDQDDADGLTFVIQLKTSDPKAFETFSKRHEPLFRQKAAKKWGSHYAAFHSAMQLVQ
ncbi:MAG TPA: DUF4286 family protein [Puia sp.]|nr:DUF4286 family protein [Puia sp.]